MFSHFFLNFTPFSFPFAKVIYKTPFGLKVIHVAVLSAIESRKKNLLLNCPPVLAVSPFLKHIENKQNSLVHIFIAYVIWNITFNLINHVQPLCCNLKSTVIAKRFYLLLYLRSLRTFSLFQPLIILFSCWILFSLTWIKTKVLIFLSSTCRHYSLIPSFVNRILLGWIRKGSICFFIQ